MPQFITLPTATPTGYGQLGQVLMSGAADYAAEKRRSDDEARVRANQLADAARTRSNQLADVQSTRDYASKVYDKERADRVKDTEAEKLFAAKTEMMRLGYLIPDKFDDEAAVKAALTQMHSAGLLTKYQGALQSGDLTYEDLSSGDETKINAGLAKFSTRLGKETTRQETSVAAAQDTANSLQAQYDQTQTQAASLEQDLARPVEESIKPPSQQETQNLALQLAQQTTGGKQPSAKDIAAQLPVAQQQLQQQHLEAAMFRKQQTQERVRLLKDQAQTLGVRLNTLANRGVFPSGKAAAGPSTLTDVSPAPTPVSASPNARQMVMQATIAGARGASSTPAVAVTSDPSLAPLPHPEAAPVAAENARRAGLAQTAQTAQMGKDQQALSDPYNESLDRINELQQQISVLSDPSYATTHPLMTGQGQSHVGLTPQQRAETLSAALTALDAEKAKLEQRRRSMLHLVDPTVAAATPQAAAPFSDAMGTTPFPTFSPPVKWWDKTAAQASGF